MPTFLLWCLLFVLCGPLELLPLVLYPLVWLLLLPFRMRGIAAEGPLEFFRSVGMPAAQNFGLRPSRLAGNHR